MTLQPEGDGTPRRRIRPSISPRGRQLLRMPIHEWEVGMLQELVQTEFDLRVLCMCGRPPTPCTHQDRRFVHVGEALYDIDMLQRMYLENSMINFYDQFDELEPDDFQIPADQELVVIEEVEDPEPISPLQARRKREHEAFWPLLRDLVIAEVARPMPHPLELRNLAPRMATLAPDLFLLDDEPQTIPERVLQQLIAEGKLQDTGSDARRRIVVVSATPETLDHAHRVVLPRWRPARRCLNRTGRRRGRKT
jgi:hypothetical protein